MKLFLIFFGFILFCISPTVSKKHEFASATVSNGKIKGYVIEPNVNRTNAVNVFKGIPFAEPPVGDLRFALPKPMKPWQGIWNATFYKSACPSNTTATSSPQKVTDEDCLYLNIFADQACMHKKCPVLYIVHGGAFYYDSAVMFNDEYIIQNYASKGIIVVIPAYRLGVFGFLDLGSDDPVPRNLGIHDLISSLYWVQNEIHAFGGDADRVTIFGNSVGGSAIAFLSAAPSVPLLWSQAFISSPDCVMMENRMYPQSVAVLEKAGCLYVGNNTNMTLSPEMQIKCLRALDWKQLIGIQRDIEDKDNLLFDGVEPDNLLFNDKSFTQLIHKYKPVPTVIGTTTEEFRVNDDEVAYNCDKNAKVFDYKEDATIQACIDKYSGLIDSNGNVPVEADMVKAEIFRIAMQIVKRDNPVWLYSWELEKHLYHTGDVSFLVGLHPINENNATWKEKLMLKYMPTVLHSFVTKGYPDKEWVQFTSYGDNYEVLDFTNTTRTLRGPHPIFQSWYPEAVSFWLGDLAAIEKVAREARLRNETINAEESWDIIAEDAREHQWKKFRDALNKSQERFKEWTNRKNQQWEKVREKNEKEYAEKIRRSREKDEAEQKQDEGILKFTDIILVQSLKETEETLKARRRQLENTGDEEGVKKIDEMLRDLGDWKDTVGDDDERIHWKDIKPAPHKSHHKSDSDSSKHESKSSSHNNIFDSLSPEEREAARIIWEEQEAALKNQHHPNNATNPNIGQRMNGTIDDIRHALNESNPGAISDRDDEKIHRDLTNDTRWQEIHNASYDKITDAKADINDKINDTKHDVAQKWNDTINDVTNRIDDAKKDIANKKEEIKENANDADKNANDKMKDQEKLRNDTIDIYNDAQKDVNKKLNDTKNDVANQWEDTAKDVQKKINDTKDDIKNEKYKGINVNEKDWIRRHNGTEGNITDDLKNIKDDIVDKWDDVKHGVEDTWNDVKHGVQKGWNDVVNNGNNNDMVNDKEWQQRQKEIENAKHAIHHGDAIEDANEKMQKLEHKKQRILGNATDSGIDQSWEDVKEKERKEALKIMGEENRKDEERMKEKMASMKSWAEIVEEKKQKLQEAEDEAREAAAEQREAQAKKDAVERRLQKAKDDEAKALAAQTKARMMASEEKEHLLKAKEDEREAIARENEAQKEQIEEKQNFVQAEKRERQAAAKEAKATEKAINEEWDLTEIKIAEAKDKLQKAEAQIDKEIEARKVAAQAVVDSLRNATYQRFLERQKLEERYQNFVNYLRNSTMKDISEKLQKLSHHQNKLLSDAKVHDYLQNRTHPSRLRQASESQLFAPLAFLAIPQFFDDDERTVSDTVVDQNGQQQQQLRQVWSAFWVILTLATLLAFILCLNAISTCLRPTRPTQGYFYNDDPGFFTEKSKIIVAQYPNYS